MRVPTSTAVCLLAALPGSLACSHSPKLQIRVEEHLITRRDVQAGGKCGSAGANAACAAGLCCSEEGICGSGGSFCVAPGCQLQFGPACDGNQTPLGKDTSGVPRPLFGSVPYAVEISHCTVPGKVALTFDDGPYIYTNDLLDVLKRNNVKATFLVVAANGGKGQIENNETGYPTIIKRMYADGHQIGSHTWSHQDLTAITAQQRRDQIIKNEIALVDIIGVIPTYFRPPYTRLNADVLADLKTFGYHVLDFDIDTRDWQGDYNAARNTYSTILTQHSPATSSWISIAHDIHEPTVHGFAQYMIDQARKLGYELVTAGECLGDPQANWYRDPTTGQPAGTVGPKQPQAAAVAASSSTGSSSAVTPTPVSDPRFGAGTGNSSQSGSATVLSGSPSVSAVASRPNFAERRLPNSLFGLFLGLLAL